MLAATCRTQNGLRDEGYISDISSHGCCLTTSTLSVRIGSHVIIRPQGLEGVSGVVRWIDGQHAGIEFIYVLEGEVGYRHGARTWLLGPGDSLYFDADAPHGPEELRKLPIRFLSVITYVRES